VFTWLCVSLGVAFGTSLLPIMNVELFVLGLVTSEPSLPWIGIGAAVAFGQVSGKLLHYLAARGIIELPSLLSARWYRGRRTHTASPGRERRRQCTTRLRRALTRIRERCHQHPHWMTATYGASSIFGLPPYMAMSVLAGLVHMRVSLFLLVGFVGRFVRFSALAAAPVFFAKLFRL
jgi:membrane protein YqaA with SNARE-associated domain